MTPSAEIRAAAAKLKAAAAAARPGPWRVVKHARRKYPSVLALAELHNPDGVMCSISWKVPGAIPDAEWGALTHPGMAGPLATWLDWAAAQADMNAIRAPRHRINIDAPLELARVLNGVTP